MFVLNEDSQPCIANINGLGGKTTSVVERLFLNLRARPSLDQFVAAAAPYSMGASVKFKLPEHCIEKSNLGMRKHVQKSFMSKGTIRFDEQYPYQVDVGYVTARQKALELAMAVDEDCMELGIDCSPKGVASWGDDRRPPLFWVNPDIDDSRVVLMYECRHFFEDDCEQLPSTLHAANELLVNAHDV